MDFFQDLVLDNTGAVLSGSRDALIRRLVPTRDFCPDESYIFSLLVNIRTFISPHELMQKIVQVRIFIPEEFHPLLDTDNLSHLSAQIVFFFFVLIRYFLFLHLCPNGVFFFSVLHVRSKCRLTQFREGRQRENVRTYLETVQ